MSCGRILFWIWLCRLGLISVWHSRVEAADEWLLEPERLFFDGFGINAKIRGKEVKRAPDRATWKKAAKGAQQPLALQIKAFADAVSQMGYTVEEGQELQRLMAQQQRQAQAAFAAGAVSLLFGSAPFSAAAQSTDQMMKSGDISKAWELQAQAIERTLESRRAAHAALFEIFGGMQQRLKRERPAADFELTLNADLKHLQMNGKLTDAPFTQPVIRIVCHHRQSEGQWTAGNTLAGAVTGGAGVTPWIPPHKPWACVCLRHKNNSPTSRRRTSRYCRTWWRVNVLP